MDESSTGLPDSLTRIVVALTLAQTSFPDDSS